MELDSTGGTGGGAENKSQLFDSPWKRKKEA